MMPRKCVLALRLNSLTSCFNEAGAMMPRKWSVDLRLLELGFALQ